MTAPIIDQAVPFDRLSVLRRRLQEQALAEQQAGIGYSDGAPDQNWDSFRYPDGQLRSDGFTKAAGDINQRVWMLINKGQATFGLSDFTTCLCKIGSDLARATY